MTGPTVKIFDLATQASLDVAHSILQTLQELSAGRPAVLGLPTGATPLGLYQEWVQMHRHEGFDWSKVQTFNLDEYWPMPVADSMSFRCFMEQNLWQPGGFDPDCVHIPSGEVAEAEIDAHCKAYDAAISAAGGLLIQVLGIGCNGHLGFNEPGASIHSRTRRVTLAARTRQRAAASFAPAEVPEYGITMGLGTILESKTIYLLAFGADKADAVATALQGPIDESCPASLLRTHADVRWVLDAEAAAGLTARG